MEHHNQNKYHGRPYGDRLVEDSTEWLMDNAPKWFRKCKNDNHEVDFDGKIFTCNTCDREETF